MNIQQKQWVDRCLGYFLIVIFFPFVRFLGITMGRDHGVNKTPEAIVFVKILGLGSLVLAIDAIKAVKASYVSSRIILLTDKNSGDGIAPFLEGVEIWVIDSSSIVRVAIQSFSFLFRTWKIRRLWICDLEVYSKLTTVFSLFTCAINRFGFVLHPVQFRKNLNTHNVYFNNFHTYTDNYRALVLAMNVNEGNFPVPNETNAKAMDKNEKKTIAINNTCSELSIYRKLPNDTLSEIIGWLLKNTSYNIALCGAPKDKVLNEYLIKEFDPGYFPNRLNNLSGLYSFPEYYEFLSTKCLFMFSIDSAPLHIAKKLGLPTYSVWGPTNPESYLKIGNLERDLHLTRYKSVLCSPCVHHTKELPCGGNNFCMKEVQPDEIIEDIKNMLRTLGHLI